ncbi:homocysteine S-methyltransferase family protein [Clostridium sp. AN503]|uniref:homocysteine S-methyltransferase family protein n=1 Tax=Clostridium sp. AN503 TaxID=3160598 RepID=UPI003458FE87
MDILQEMQNRILFCDGGLGSLLQANGLKPGELPGTWNISHPEVLVDIHRAYLEAGADIVTTNTFGVDSLKYHAGTEYGLEQVITAAIRNGKEAIRLSGKQAYVALDLGPTGKLLKPLGDLAFEDACGIYKEVIEIAVREGVDLILIETMSDSYETKAAVLAAKENSSLPVFVTVTFDERGKLLTGGSPASIVAMLEGLGVDALGMNCGLGPVQMKDTLKEILAVSSIPVIVNPNAGLPRSEHGNTVYDIDADAFAQTMAELVDMGARIVGGCCGTTPEHIRKLVELCREKTPVPVAKKSRTVVASFAQAVEIGGSPVIIGERINPTGKSKFKQALRDHNLEYILKEGVTQQDHGAHVLDVNVGLPEIDEPSMMVEVVRELQSIIDLPLQLDTSDPVAMEQAMRIYNGKPLINSVNGKEESMRAIFPLVKKYGGVVVALALDEEGIPETAKGRIRVAEKIYRTAAEYGIGPEDILIDALCLTVSSDSQGAITTLETLRRVRDELHGKTILGVSNISFGLPQREIINAAFFTMAMQNGLSAAIINPNSEAMMRAYYSFRALMGMDAQCGEYIQVYGGQAATLGQSAVRGQAAGAPGQMGSRTGAVGRGTGSGNAAADGADSMGTDDAGAVLRNSIERGLKEQAAKAVSVLLESKDALDIISGQMIPALDLVGRGFENGTLFLPQLLMSAEAAKAAFEIIKDAMTKSGQKQEKKGTIILATVKGDIHDIGKNIVKVLLENYSYDVLDLGKDVPPESIVETAVERQVKLVGLSALMTTTVPSMEATIRQLRQAAPWTKVMVGGAVLTEEYAKTMGADRYCRDAMASVNYAEEVFGS